MSTKQIIEEIEKLPPADKEEVYSYFSSKLQRKKYALSVLNKIKGSGKNVWGMDAQEYVNQLRSDDRI